jgi:uncharacterized protein (TIGR03067 family)
LVIYGNPGLFYYFQNKNVMRLLSLFSLLIASFGYNAGYMQTQLSELNGNWVPVTQEMSGKQLPTAMFEKQTLVIQNNLYVVTAESIDKGELTYGNGKMDIYGKEGVNAGKHFTAIYKYEKGQLTICYNLLGDSYPEAFETKSKRLLFLSVFKKTMMN